MACSRADWENCLSASPYLQSVIQDNGRYVPGKKGNTYLRTQNARALFDQHPEIQQRFADDPASWRFHRRHLLRFQDRMVDGFRARFLKELVLVDACTDSALRRFLRHLRTLLPPVSVPPKERLRVLASAVADAFGGGSVDEKENPVKRLEERVRKLQLPPPADLPIGRLMGGDAVGKRRRGAGICRHRAILLKYACDALGLAECALIAGVLVPTGIRDVGEYRKTHLLDHMWNVVRIQGALFLVDTMLFPGDVWSVDDLSRLRERMEYHRLGGQAGMDSLDRAASRSRRRAAASLSFVPGCDRKESNGLEESDCGCDRKVSDGLKESDCGCDRKVSDGLAESDCGCDQKESDDLDESDYGCDPDEEMLLAVAEACSLEYGAAAE